MKVIDVFARLLSTFAVCAMYTSAPAQVPATERAVLIDIYNSTNGENWTAHQDWNGPVGTECGWYGVLCTGDGSHVVYLGLAQRNLAGSLPNLDALPYINHLEFYSNQLTGPIPPLQNLPLLQVFSASGNQFTGPIPTLTGLTHLENFSVTGNLLTGSIPTLHGLTTLQIFFVGNNRLTGSIPSLDGLASLQFFHVNDNMLTGSIPPLAGLSNLKSFYVGQNFLTGDLPAPPPDLAIGGSRLCANNLNLTSNPAWDSATGRSPWWASPFASNVCDDIFTSVGWDQ